jgi:GNAT superfamily N-acetyltransferase
MKDYIIKKTGVLTNEQQKELDCLIESCDGYEPFTDCGFPVFYAETEGVMTGFLSYVCTENGKNKEIEVTALVHPLYRGRGIFKALLSELKSCEKTAVYIVQAENDIHSIYKGYAYSEYLMKHTGGSFEDNLSEMSDDYESCFSDDQSDFLLYHGDDDEPCAVCSLDYNDSFTSLYGVYVDEDIRKKGIGTHLMRELLTCYFEKNKKPLVLNVRSTNTAAVKLYQKCGFTIESKEDYFYL